MIYVSLKFIFIAAQIKYVLLKISSISFLTDIELSNSEAALGFKHRLCLCLQPSCLLFGTLNIRLLMNVLMSLFALSNIRSTK